MTWVTGEALNFFLGVFFHLCCAVAFALAPWYAAHYDTDGQDMYNLLAPPNFVLSIFVFLLTSVRSGGIVFKRQYTSLIGRVFDRITDNHCIGVLSLLTFAGCVALFLLLLGFMLVGSLRVYLAPVALTLMWYKSIPYYDELDNGLQQRPKNAINAIKLAIDEISVRVWFTWLTAATIFSFIDIAQFLEAQYFSFAVYLNLMVVLIAVAIVLYISSRDPAVAWCDAKETVETLQTVASAIAPIFAIVLAIDTTQGFYDFFVKFVPRSDVSGDADGRLNAGYGAV
ncbi:hypothetical protein PHYSODRAFT_262843 [Phytophthora sojae]|uniref:Uncharacterized protein n=1 Tax=Phytophthora sojae (strain P6497) TaxID=1094619 RepID=G4ZBS6_PHYSP|nr:hypothetical protein PHYSODRAFT_262843 [Phytophthora sojae]EGZ21280.1 hypothetical protein PHYSODRAFT_262843 [Phytophthora sojae]|eukprot:XP_009523997.1 hypothetical protein PHYSODRAFT_262843 [Phytophthora sojae]